MKTVWTKNSQFFNLNISSGSESLDRLPAGVYNIHQSKEGLFLERRPQGFSYPEKMYGMEDAFIQRVARTFERTEGNLGVMLTGIRGTGKTVTAELLAERIGLPIILISQDLPGMIDFIDSFPHSATFLCDEFEKVFHGGGDPNAISIGGQNERGASKLLPLMDGVMNSAHRKVFIFTTNRLTIEPNMLQRPGRIRYLKEFANLPRTTIEMIVDDLLVRKELRDDVIHFIARLEIITIDIVTTVIEEMNIHGGSPESLDGVLNVKRMEALFDVVTMDKEMEEKRRRYSVIVKPDDLSEEHIGCELIVDGYEYGSIVSVKGHYVTIDRSKHLDTDDEDYSDKRTATLKITPVRRYNRDSFGHDYAKEKEG